MKLNFIVKSRSGKWTIRFGVVLVIATVLSVIFAFAIGGNADVITSSFLLSIFANVLSVIFTLSGPLSFFLGIYTVIKHKEWSICKPLIILYIFTFLIFLLGEFLFQH
jgi:hypothetical protein